MNRLAALFLLLVLVGCHTQRPDPKLFSAYLYPDSTFIEERSTTIFDEHDKTVGRPVSRKELHDWYARVDGMTEAEWQECLNDPFHVERHCCILFGIVPPRITAKEVMDYYSPLLTKDGWESFRAGLPTETTMGSDWIRAYKRDHQLFEIHIMGPWEENKEKRAAGDFRASNIRFRFLGLNPTALFGNEYRLKGKEPFQEQYHRGTARNMKEDMEK